MTLRILSSLLVGLFLFTACAGRPPVGEYTIRGYEVSDLFPEPRLQSLASAACSGSGTTVKSLVASGVDPSGFGEFRETALLWALHCRSLRGVEALLVNGAEPEQRAVRAAAHIGNPAFLEAVLKAGGNPNHYETFSEAIYTMGNRYNDGRHYNLLFAYGAEVGKTKILNMLITANEYCRAEALLNEGYAYDLAASLRHLNKFIHPENPDIRANNCFSDLEARLVEAVD